MSEQSNNPYIRQQDLIPLDRLQDYHLIVVGTGAVGRPLAINLAAAGARSVELWDHDTVEMVNVAIQGFSLLDVGHRKVDAVKHAMEAVNGEMTVEVNPRRFIPGRIRQLGEQAQKTVVFLCPDSIEVRREVFEVCVLGRIPLVVDGRMSGETLQWFTATPETYADYRRTLFPQAEAHQGRCTGRSTMHGASVLAGFMVAQLTRFLRNEPTDRSMMLDIRFSSLMPVDFSEDEVSEEAEAVA